MENPEHYSVINHRSQLGLTEKRLAMINRMLEKLNRNNGIAVGYHGTSRSRAEQILANGFENRVAADGQRGVFMWDEEYRQNAEMPGESKAKEDGDAEYALLKIEMLRAEPDWLMGRPQWKGMAEDCRVLGVEYFPVRR